MAAYISFLFKRLRKRKSNIIVFVFTAIIITVVHILNGTNQARIINNVEYEISFYQESMSHEQNIDFKLEVKNREDIIRYFEKGDWTKLYQRYTQIIKENNEKLTNYLNDQTDQNYDLMLKQSNQQIAYFEYLEKNTLHYEDREYPVFSATFTMYIFEHFLPVVFMAYIVYILAQLYTLDTPKDINISKLLPFNKSTKKCAQIGAGMIVVSGSLLGLVFISFIISFIFTRNFGLGYPVLEENYVRDSWQIVSVNGKLLECMVLGILYGFTISLIMYHLSKQIMDDTQLTVFSILLFVGLAYGVLLIEPLKSIAHLLPTSYLNFGQVVLGRSCYDFSNPHMTFRNGCFVLVTFNLCLVGWNILCDFIRSKTIQRS